jgi:hypothetical protein
MFEYIHKFHLIVYICALHNYTILNYCIYEFYIIINAILHILIGYFNTVYSKLLILYHQKILEYFLYKKKIKQKHNKKKQLKFYLNIVKSLKNFNLSYIFLSLFFICFKLKRYKYYNIIILIIKKELLFLWLLF